MEKNIKLIILIFIIFVNSIVISGCWNYREISDVLIVSGVAIDKNENNDGYILSIETISPKGGEKVEMIPSVYSAEGKTIFDAIRNSIQLSGRKMYWSHAKVIIVSEKIAKEGITPILDFFNRSAEVRSDIKFLISLEKTAKEILEGKDIIHNTLSYHLEEMLESEKSIPKYHAVELYQFIDDLSCKIMSPIAPTTKMTTIKDMKIPKIFGTAVFKKDKMIGWLNEIDTRNLIIIKGEEFKGGVILVENVLDKKVDIALEVFDSKTKLTPKLLDNNIVMDIDVKMNVEIIEVIQYAEKEDFINKEGREKFKTYAEESIKKEIESVIKKVQRDYKTDIFGFGKKVKINMPKKFKEIQNNWEDIFSNLDTNVNVELTIHGSSLTLEPIKAD